MVEKWGQNWLLHCDNMPMSHMSHSAAVFGEEPNRNHHPSTGFSRSCPVQRAVLPKTRNWDKMSLFYICARIQQYATASLTAIPKKLWQKYFASDMTAGARKSMC